MSTFATPTQTAEAAGLRRSPEPPSPTSASSRSPRRSRGASLTESIMSARPPPGVLAATGHAIGKGPSIADLRRSSAGSIQTTGGRRKSTSRRESSVSAITGGLSPAAPIQEMKSEDYRQPAVVDSLVVAGERSAEEDRREAQGLESGDDEDDKGKEGKPGWWPVTKGALLAFWNYFKTPLGFFVTIYMLNVVAWGGMLFLLLCNASPAMCKPDCNHINSPRRIWIEITSQILNALFCVTGFGLIPWRFRDLYYLLKWRWFGKTQGYIKLQEINSAWYRPGPPVSGTEEDQKSGTASSETPTATEDTVTGQKAPPTKSWKLDYVIWLYCWNTFFQIVLSGFMWGMNRYDRPPWSTGLFVALSFIVAGMAGGQVWWETRKIKRIEGTEEDHPETEPHGPSVTEKISGPAPEDDRGRHF